MQNSLYLVLDVTFPNKCWFDLRLLWTKLRWWCISCQRKKHRVMPSCVRLKWFQQLFAPCRTLVMWRPLAALLAPCTTFPTIVRGSLQSLNLEASQPWSRCWGEIVSLATCINGEIMLDSQVKARVHLTLNWVLLRAYWDKNLMVVQKHSF